MTITVTLILVFVATALTGLLAGMSLDKSIVQLPARHRMGVVEFAAFSRANDLGNGLITYPVLGLGSTVLTITAGIASYWQGTSLTHAWSLYVSVLLTLLHTVCTTQAAPNMLRLRQPINDEKTLTLIFNRFERWHTMRAILQIFNFITLAWALVVYANML
jgi:hypothetical protein